MSITHLNLSKLEEISITDLSNFNDKLFYALLNNLINIKRISFKEISFNRTIFNATNLATNKWDNLCSLTISNSYLENEGVKTITSVQNWVSLKYLCLKSNTVRDLGAKEIALNKSWLNLEHLDLENNLIGKDGGESLATLSNWESLNYLNIKNNNIYKRTYIDLNIHSEKRKNSLLKRKFSSLTGMILI